MPEDQCRSIFKQLICGVGQMHSQGYAHRDLKLENLLYDVDSDQIKIIDFGFSLRVKED